MEKKYLMSVDGGGTKTAVCVFHTETGERKYFAFGSTNYKAVGREVSEHTMRELFCTIMRELEFGLEDIRGVVIGVSGCDTEKDYQVYQSMIRKTELPPERVYLCNDSELAFFSVAEPPGICVISGTGSIAIGFDRNGESVRCGGWGSPLSDSGSGYYIGEQAIRQLIYYYDGLIEKEPVFEKLREFYRIKKEEKLPEILTNMSIMQIASCALLISDEAEMGDAFCLKLITEAAEHVAELAHVVYRKLQMQGQRFCVVESGSIFKGYLYTEIFETKLGRLTGSESITYKKSDTSPADSGIEVAKNLFYRK